MTHNPMALSSEIALYKQVREQIRQSFGLEDDDEALLDSTDGETGLTDLLCNLMREARREEAEAKGLAELIRLEQERKQRKEDKARRLRAIVLNAMTDANLPKLSAPDFSASRSRSQAPLVITDESQVPDDYCRHKREIDKVKLRDAIKNGAAFPYAFLGNPSEALVVRAS